MDRGIAVFTPRDAANPEQIIKGELLLQQRQHKFTLIDYKLLNVLHRTMFCVVPYGYFDKETDRGSVCFFIVYQGIQVRPSYKTGGVSSRIS